MLKSDTQVPNKNVLCTYIGVPILNVNLTCDVMFWSLVLGRDGQIIGRI